MALKIAMAYERSLHFEKVTREQAERVFRLKESDITQVRYQMFSGLFVLEYVKLRRKCHFHYNVTQEWGKL